MLIFRISLFKDIAQHSSLLIRPLITIFIFIISIILSHLKFKYVTIIHSSCDGSVLQSVLDETVGISLAINNSIRTTNG